jgi:hypothetical protein
VVGEDQAAHAASVRKEDDNDAVHRELLRSKGYGPKKKWPARARGRKEVGRRWAAPDGEGEMGMREWEPKGGLGVDFYFKTSFPFSFSKLFYKYFLYTKIVRENYVFI